MADNKFQTPEALARCLPMSRLQAVLSGKWKILILWYVAFYRVQRFGALLRRLDGITQSTLTRTEVSGGGRKPWRQKGTGHARQGSTRAPQWTHGGIVFAPKPRDYSYVLNKKVKRLALKSVLSAKVAEGEMVVIDSIKMDAIKTADFRKFLTAVGVDGKAMVVTPAVDQTIVKSARNIPGVVTTPASILSVYDILNAKYLVVDKDALAKIEEVYA